MHSSAVILLLITIGITVAEKLPEQYYGKFTLDHSENFDEYLSAKGYGWLTRKLVQIASFDKVFKKAGGNKFDYANLTSKKNVYYNGVELGKEFVGEGLDSTKHKITFFLRGKSLIEKHVPTDPSGTAKAEDYEYHFEGPFMVVSMNANGVVGKRFYKKV